MLLERLHDAHVERAFDQSVDVEEFVHSELPALHVDERLKFSLALLHEEVLDAVHELTNVPYHHVRVRLCTAAGALDEVLNEVPKVGFLVLGQSINIQCKVP